MLHHAVLEAHSSRSRRSATFPAFQIRGTRSTRSSYIKLSSKMRTILVIVSSRNQLLTHCNAELTRQTLITSVSGSLHLSIYLIFASYRVLYPHWEFSGIWLACFRIRFTKLPILSKLVNIPRSCIARCHRLSLLPFTLCRASNPKAWRSIGVYVVGGHRYALIAEQPLLVPLVLLYRVIAVR